jgi:hypothetical protein
VPDATLACPDLTTFCRLDELGLVVFGQRLEPDRAVFARRVLEPDEWCRHCGSQGSPRDTVLRRLKHEDTVAAPATRSTASAACCAPAPTCSPIGNANG